MTTTLWVSLTVIVICLAIALRMRRGFSRSRASSVITMGATHHLINDDRKRAAETVLQKRDGQALEKDDPAKSSGA